LLQVSASSTDPEERSLRTLLAQFYVTLHESTISWIPLPWSLFSGVASPKFWGDLLTLNEQQYFIWDTASQRTKWQGMLQIWAPLAPMASSMFLLTASTPYDLTIPTLCLLVSKIKPTAWVRSVT